MENYDIVIIGGIRRLAYESCRIFRAGQLFLKGVQPETIVYTLIQYLKVVAELMP
mgnify:CR=1 FL=1